MNKELLRQAPIFNGISDAGFEKLQNCLNPKTQSYSKNELIYSIGDKATHIAFILSGSVRIITEDYAGNTDIAAVLEKGDMFGDICAGVEKSEITARAADQTQIMFVEYSNILGMCRSVCDHHTQALSNLFRIFAVKNRELGEKLQILQKRTLREKLLAYLYTQAKKEGGSKFNIPLSRAGLAEYLCVDRSAMSRELCGMRNDGLLEFYKSAFILKDDD